MIEKILDKRQAAMRWKERPPLHIKLALLVDPITEADVVISRDFRPLPLNQQDGAIGEIYGMRIMVIAHAQELCEVVIIP